MTSIGQLIRSGHSFTLEPGKGETYRTDKPTLYAHGVYERSSVLAGRPKRLYVHCWDTWEEARTAVNQWRQDFGQSFRCDELQGSTHIPSSRLVSHLPDDTDY